MSSSLVSTCRVFLLSLRQRFPGALDLSHTEEFLKCLFVVDVQMVNSGVFLELM